MARNNGFGSSRGPIRPLPDSDESENEEQMDPSISTINGQPTRQEPTPSSIQQQQHTQPFSTSMSQQRMHDNQRRIDAVTRNQSGITEEQRQQQRQLEENLRQREEALRVEAQQMEQERQDLQRQQQELDVAMQQMHVNSHQQRPRQSSFQQSAPAFRHAQSFGPPLINSTMNQNAGRQGLFSPIPQYTPQRSTSIASLTDNASSAGYSNRRHQLPPTRMTERSLVPVNSYGIYNNVNKTVNSICFALKNDTVCIVTFRPQYVTFKLKSNEEYSVVYNELPNFVRQLMADYNLQIQSTAMVPLLPPSTEEWTAFLRQTVDAHFSGVWNQNNIFVILDSFSDLQQCYFNEINWPQVRMKFLRQHLPVLSTLSLDSRQSTNSTFLHVLKYVTMAAHDGQYQFINLVLFVTDFPAASALDDYLFHMHQYVSQKAFIFVDLPPDDAFLRVLRHRQFAAAGIITFPVEKYIVFERQISGMSMFIGFKNLTDYATSNQSRHP